MYAKESGKNGMPRFNELTDQGEKHPIEKIGKKLRGMMPWLKEQSVVDRKKN